jgi:hypothetical protein
MAPRPVLGEAPRQAVVLTAGVRDPRSAEALRARIRSAFAERTDLALVDDAAAGRVFRIPAPKGFGASIANARKALERAEKAMRSFDLEKAQLGYVRATDLLEPHLGLRASRAVDEERLALGVALAHARRSDEELDLLLLEYAVRYGRDAPPQSWPPDLTSRLHAMTPAEAARVRVESTPPGAEVFVDGARAGVTPLELSVRPGAHRIEVEIAGMFPSDAWVRATTLAEETARFELAPDISRLLELQPQEPLPPELAARVLALATTLGADLAIIGTRSGPRVTVASLSATGESRHDADDSDEGVRLAIAQLFAPPDTGGGLRVPVWASIGAGVAAAAIGAGIGLRYAALDAQDDLIAREGALTQREAFDRRDGVDARAKSGAVLIGVGSVAFAGFMGWMTYDLVASEAK